MKLGEMLTRDGRVTDAQMQRALAIQGQQGGRLGTALVQAGSIDFDTLTVYLGIERAISIATGAALERAKSSAVKLLSPTQATKFRCVPLVVQDRQLIAAVADPADQANLDAIQHAIGYRVLPRVAPEARIYYYIERYYGVPRPARFAALGDAIRGQDAVPAGLPAAPLPGLPPRNLHPTPAPTPKPRLQHGKPVDEQALELDAEDLIDSLESDSSPPSPVAKAAAAGGGQAAAGSGQPGPGQTSAATAPPPIEPLDEASAVKALGSADDRNQIGGILLRYAAGLFTSSVLFTVRDNYAFGWRAAGELPGHAHLEYLYIPLELPSIFQAATTEAEGVYVGAVAPSTLHNHIYKLLGTDEPLQAAVGVVSIGKRPVNLVYGHRAVATGPAERASLVAVCAAAAQAYARLIAVAKKKR